MLIQYWESFLMPHQGAGAISASGNGSDVIQDGGRKRKLLLLLDRASKGLLILLYALLFIPVITNRHPVSHQKDIYLVIKDVLLTLRVAGDLRRHYAHLAYLASLKCPKRRRIWTKILSPTSAIVNCSKATLLVKSFDLTFRPSLYGLSQWQKISYISQWPQPCWAVDRKRTNMCYTVMVCFFRKPHIPS